MRGRKLRKETWNKVCLLERSCDCGLRYSGFHMVTSERTNMITSIALTTHKNSKFFGLLNIHKWEMYSYNPTRVVLLEL